MDAGTDRVIHKTDCWHFKERQAFCLQYLLATPPQQLVKYFQCKSLTKLTDGDWVQCFAKDVFGWRALLTELKISMNRAINGGSEARMYQERGDGFYSTELASGTPPHLYALNSVSKLRTDPFTRFFCLFAIFFAIQTLVSGAIVEGGISPFTAEGTVSLAILEPGNSNAIFQMEATFHFSYSNKWWQVELAYLSPQEYVGTVENCKRVVDGIRYFSTRAATRKINTNQEIWTAATALPIAFPRPDRTDLFLCWLSLCPDAELPIIDGSRIRRFTDPSLLNHPKNEGRYAVKYLQPDQRFISELSITNNNGIIFRSDGGYSQDKGPLENGFIDSKYELLEVTNFNSMPFPLHAILYRFARPPDATRSDEVYTAIVARIEIQKIVGGVMINTSVKNLLAVDARPAGLSEKNAIKYAVTNDFWQPITNQRIRKLASVNINSPPEEHGSKRGARFFLALLVILVFVPIVIFLFNKKTNLSNKK